MTKRKWYAVELKDGSIHKFATLREQVEFCVAHIELAAPPPDIAPWPGTPEFEDALGIDQCLGPDGLLSGKV